MANITVRNLDDRTKALLRIRAAHRGHSMEEEAREILRSALSAADGVEQDLATCVHRRFRAIGGVELDLAPREPMREPPALAE